ncbi:hypothetical protein PGTUg99_020515 [Puccinia graminis f. sp. tritici]|uniref:Uncharacterized protein n=1 Tax=Puccinia graminis f. sp. tritici TaxID=56615 RepID=A0A5B0PTQ7_PUCGR|nr:hypothetical protein PGTUg99_020515 [Puccinia graminis f. sp. tritici]
MRGYSERQSSIGIVLDYRMGASFNKEYMIYSSVIGLCLMKHLTSSINQYICSSTETQLRDEFDLKRLFNMPDIEFRQSSRTSKAVFVGLLNIICMNPVFPSWGDPSATADSSSTCAHT